MQIRNLPGTDWNKKGFGGREQHTCMSLLKISSGCTSHLDRLSFSGQAFYIDDTGLTELSKLPFREHHHLLRTFNTPPYSVHLTESTLLQQAEKW